jgi:hypothetical protein
VGLAEDLFGRETHHSTALLRVSTALHREGLAGACLRARVRDSARVRDRVRVRVRVRVTVLPAPVWP